MPQAATADPTATGGELGLEPKGYGHTHTHTHTHAHTHTHTPTRARCYIIMAHSLSNIIGRHRAKFLRVLMVIALAGTALLLSSQISEKQCARARITALLTELRQATVIDLILIISIRSNSLAA